MSVTPELVQIERQPASSFATSVRLGPSGPVVGARKFGEWEREGRNRLTLLSNDQEPSWLYSRNHQACNRVAVQPVGQRKVDASLRKSESCTRILTLFTTLRGLVLRDEFIIYVSETFSLLSLADTEECH